MKCEDCRARMPEYWEDELTDEQRAEVELHLTSCAACRDEADGLSAVWHGLERIPAERRHSSRNPPPSGDVSLPRRHAAGG